MAFENVYGQDRVKQILTSSLQRKRLAHAYLFHGSPGVGKDAMGIAIVKSLTCQEKVNGGCGICAACSVWSGDRNSFWPSNSFSRGVFSWEKTDRYAEPFFVSTFPILGT